MFCIGYTTSGMLHPILSAIYQGMVKVKKREKELHAMDIFNLKTVGKHGILIQLSKGLSCMKWDRFVQCCSKRTGNSRLQGQKCGF